MPAAAVLAAAAAADIDAAKAGCSMYRDLLLLLQLLRLRRC
jgi:hypothetical protein